MDPPESASPDAAFPDSPADLPRDPGPLTCTLEAALEAAPRAPALDASSPGSAAEASCPPAFERPKRKLAELSGSWLGSCEEAEEDVSAAAVDGRLLSCRR